MYLAEIKPVYYECLGHKGYNKPAVNGSLGYEDRLVSVDGVSYRRAISAHPPSRVDWFFEHGVEYVSTRVAINDTARKSAKANFYVYADDMLVGCALNVNKDDKPIFIEAWTCGAKKISLRIEVNNYAANHAVWLDPVVLADAPSSISTAYPEITFKKPDSLVNASKVVSVAVTPEYTEMADDMLASLWLNGRCSDAALVLITTSPESQILSLAEKYNASIVEIEDSEKRPMASKMALTSIALASRADSYLLLDADMFVLDSIESLFQTSHLANGSFAVCEEQHTEAGDGTLGQLLSEDRYPYHGEESDLALLGVNERLASFGKIVNTGVMAMDRQTALNLHTQIASFAPGSSMWLKKNPNLYWREQGIVNLAAAKSENVTLLSPKYNVQLLNNPNLKIRETAGGLKATNTSYPVHILHYNGKTEKEISKYRGAFSRRVDKAEFGVSLAGFEQFYDVGLSRYGSAFSDQSLYPYEMDTFSSKTDVRKSVFAKIVSVLEDFSHKKRILDITGTGGIASAMMVYHFDSDVLCVQPNGDEICEPLNFLNEQHLSRISVVRDDPVSYLSVSEDDLSFDICMVATNTRNSNVAALLHYAITVAGETLLFNVDNPLCDHEVLLERLEKQGFAFDVLMEKKVYGEKTPFMYRVFKIEESS